jgi:ATP-dependent DNA helicase PIF1
MRVLKNGDNHEAREFLKFLLDIGDGSYPTHPDIGTSMVQIPQKYIFESGREDSPQKFCDFLQWCYPNLHSPQTDLTEITTKAILAPKNTNVDLLNDEALSRMYGVEICLLSVDSVEDSNDTTNRADLFPVEFLNFLTIAGMPPHKLRLKIGIPVILLKNLNPALGLCNGTRLQVQHITQRLLTVKIPNGSNEGDITHIPRIDLIESSGDLPFHLKRRQFPIKVAFAMTINKAQGQSLKQVGIFYHFRFLAMGNYMLHYRVLEILRKQKYICHK